MPRTLFINAKYKGKITLTEKLKSYLEKHKPKSIAVFASVQFQELDNLFNEINKLGIKVNTTKAKRTDKPLQILGCDCYEDSFEQNILAESELIMYVGDGLFHPKALLLAQSKLPRVKPVAIFNPVANSIEELTKDSIENQLLRMKRNLRLYVNAKSIGIIVTIKPGQQYLLSAKNLKEKLEEKGKNAFIFITDSLLYNDLENYPFIEAWVNTACPRIGTDDIVNIKQPIVNLREAFEPEKALGELG